MKLRSFSRSQYITNQVANFAASSRPVKLEIQHAIRSKSLLGAMVLEVKRIAFVVR